MAARIQDPSISCTPSGEFEQLQCRERGEVTICRCVRPDNGARLPGTTEVVVTRIEDIPNCDILSKNCKCAMSREHLADNLTKL